MVSAKKNTSKLTNFGTMHLFVFFINILAILLYFSYFHGNYSLEFRTLLFWSILAIIADSLVIELGNGVGISVSLGIALAAIFTSGPLVGSLSAVIGTLLKVSRLRDKTTVHIFNTPYYKTLFNVGNLFLSSSFTGIIYISLGGNIGNQSFVASLLPIVIGLFTYVFINSMLMAILISIITDNYFPRVLIQNILGVLPSTIGIGSMGLILALAYVSYGPFAVLLFFGPLLLARYSYKLYFDLRFSYMDTINALNKSMEAKDSYTSGHASRVQRYAMLLGKNVSLGPQRLDKLNTASLLHDIGKIGVDESILNKPESLSQEEFSKIHKHPEIGYQILKDVDFLKDVAKIIKHHHERYDGKGYPDGISGKDIPTESAIIAIADTFDAITSDRSYRKRSTKEFALKEIEKNAGKQFDPDLAKKFVEIVADYEEEDVEYVS